MAQKLNLQQFNPQELYQLKQGFQNQLTTFGQSLNQLRFALDKYEEGKRSIKAVEETDDREEVLMPLSNSLYIEGYLSNKSSKNKVYLVEYGAGFFVERNAQEAIEFYIRKINLIKEKITKLQQIIADKRENLRNIQIRIYSLIQQQQQQAPPQKS